MIPINDTGLLKNEAASAAYAADPPSKFAASASGVLTWSMATVPPMTMADWGVVDGDDMGEWMVDA
jgi:hypothetical protein